MSDVVDVSISMAIHVGDLLRETGHLAPAEMGAHVRLMLAAWTRGGHLPAAPDRLRRLAGVDVAEWPATWRILTDLWPASADGSTVSHARTVAELERARNLKSSAVARAKAARAAQLAGPKPAPSRPQAGPPTPTPTPTPDPTPDPPPPPPPADLKDDHQLKYDHCPAGGPAGPGGGGGEVQLQLVPSEAEPEASKARKAKPDSGHHVWAVYRHYWSRGHSARKPSPTSKTYRAIAARLKDGWTIEELCKAIDGYHLSPFHQGQNEAGTKYLDLELFMRSEEKVQKGIDFAEHPPKPGNGAKPGRDPRVGWFPAEACQHPDKTGRVDLP